MFEPQFRASTDEVYTFAPRTPPITVTASHNTTCRPIHSSWQRNLREALARRLYGTDIRGKQDSRDRARLRAVRTRRQSGEILELAAEMRLVVVAGRERDLGQAPRRSHVSERGSEPAQPQ